MCFHLGVWILGVFHSWNDNLSSVVAYAYNLLRWQSKTVITSSKTSKDGWSTLWLFSQVGLWITLFMIKQKIPENKTKHPEIYMKPVLVWSITCSLQSCSGVWFIYLVTLYWSKVFFPFHRYYMYAFLNISFYIFYISFLLRGRTLGLCYPSWYWAFIWLGFVHVLGRL